MKQMIATVQLAYQGSDLSVASEHGAHIGFGRDMVRHWTDLAGEAGRLGWQLFELVRDDQRRVIEMVYTKDF